MNTALRASAYPKTVDELLPDALALMSRLGQLPSRNRLMNELRIGSPKAGQLLERLTGNADVSAHTPTRLHLVPTPDTDEPTEGGNLISNDVAPVETNELVREHVDPVQMTGAPAPTPRPIRVWPVYLLALPAFVAVWSGWVGLGELTGFGVVHPLPGIWDSFSINTAITLPIGVETYAAFALRVWLTGPLRVRRFARWSAIGSLILGAVGQVAYHLMTVEGVQAGRAPWPITMLVACLPVAVLGMGAALAHLLHTKEN